VFAGGAKMKEIKMLTTETCNYDLIDGILVEDDGKVYYKQGPNSYKIIGKKRGGE